MDIKDLLAFPGMNFAATTAPLGGTAAPGGEPDIFAGVDTTGGAGGEGAPPVESETPVEEAPVEETTVETPVEETPAGEEQPPVEGEQPPVEEQPPVAAVPPKPAPRPALTEEDKKVEATLQDVYRDHPKLKDVLKADPTLRPVFFKAAQINKIYPTIEDAERAKSWALDLYHLDQKFYGEDKRDFIRTLWEETLDKDGKSTGHFEKMAEVISSDVINAVEQQIAQDPRGFVEAFAKYNLTDKQLATAVQITKLLISHVTGQSWTSPDAGLTPGGARPAAPGAPAVPNAPAGQESYTPREKQLLQRAMAAEAKNAETSQTNAKTAEETFNKQIFDNFFTDFQDGVNKRLSASIPLAVRENPIILRLFGEEALKRVHSAMNADELFDATVASAAKSGDRGPQHVQQIADMMKQRAQLLLPGVVRKLAAEFSAKSAPPPKQGQNATRGAVQNGPRREPATGGGPARLTRPAGTGSRPPARPSGETVQNAPLKSQGDYKRDADRILGLDEE